MTNAELTDPIDRSEAPEAGLIGWAERGYLPDVILRAAIRRLCAYRLRTEQLGAPEAVAARFETRLASLRSSAVAIHTSAANRQHYELPAEFFQHCLGPRLKYSCAYFSDGHESLGEAEVAMLELTTQRAELEDDQDILELGCGWGSLTLWMAERFPRARITAVSNSHSQRRFIEARCRERGFAHVRVLTCDVNDIALDATSFDRVVSVEMFEHVRNYERLFRDIARWLRPDGALFAHIFCHRTALYAFDDNGNSDWMSRHFFTGGLMPSVGTLARFQNDLTLEHQWLVDGRHYARTANLWLENQDLRRDAVLDALTPTYGAATELWIHRWRMFWMACAELFGYANGAEWMVAHHRFVKRGAA